MHIAEILIIAVGVSMDAFAVSICKGLSVRTLQPKHAALTAATLWLVCISRCQPPEWYGSPSCLHCTR